MSLTPSQGGENAARRVRSVVGIDPGYRHLLVWAPVTMGIDTSPLSHRIPPTYPGWAREHGNVHFAKGPPRMLIGRGLTDRELANLPDDVMLTKAGDFLEELGRYWRGDEGVSSRRAAELLLQCRRAYSQEAEKIARFTENYHARVAVEWEPRGAQPMGDLDRLPPEFEGHRGADIGGHPYNSLPVQFFVDDLAMRLRKRGLEDPLVLEGGYSRTCSRCLAFHWDSLDETTFRCPGCGYEADRDVNAAYVIAVEGWGKITRPAVALGEPGAVA